MVLERYPVQDRLLNQDVLLYVFYVKGVAVRLKLVVRSTASTTLLGAVPRLGVRILTRLRSGVLYFLLSSQARAVLQVLRVQRELHFALRHVQLFKVTTPPPPPSASTPVQYIQLNCVEEGATKGFIY